MRGSDDVDVSQRTAHYRSYTYSSPGPWPRLEHVDPAFHHPSVNQSINQSIDQPSRAPPFLKHRFPSTYQRQRFWFGGRVRRSSMPTTYTTRTQPHIALWLERPVRWTRSQCITVAQLRTGHCPLLASYLHRIGRQQSPVCPHCGGDDETAQHLLLCCPSRAGAIIH